jgi:hypothetical protein
VAGDESNGLEGRFRLRLVFNNNNNDNNKNNNHGSNNNYNHSDNNKHFNSTPSALTTALAAKFGFSSQGDRIKLRVRNFGSTTP